MVRTVGSVGMLRGRSVPVGVGRLDVLVGLLHLRVGGDDVGGAEVHPDGRVGLEAPLGATLVDVAPVRHLHLDYVLDLLQLLLLHEWKRLASVHPFDIKLSDVLTDMVCFMTSAFSPVAILSEYLSCSLSRMLGWICRSRMSTIMAH